jgi:HPt (histidine-containing phosphotransfer) domain-containing protein
MNKRTIKKMTTNQSDNDQGVAPIDLESCIRMFNGQRDVVLELVGDLLRLYDEQKKTIVEALAENDPEKLRREAHSVKGGAAVLSAGPLLEAAKVLEEIGRSGDLSGGEEAFTRLEGEAARLAACCESLKQ